MHPKYTTNDAPQLCACGCGQPAPIATQNNAKTGAIKGQPQRFIHGHHARLQPVRPVTERFWEKVDKRGPDECWEWQGRKNVKGYGKFTYLGNECQSHRVGWELVNGQIPDGLQVCHHCDNPSCNNPAHWFLGTQAENVADMMNKGRHVPSRGERQGSAKLTASAVIEIRRLHREGMTKAAIARQFKMSHATICDVVKRRTWSHVP